MRKIAVFFIGLASLLIAGSGIPMAAEREPAVAGKFYPPDSSELKNMVSGHLAAVTDLPEIDGQIIALMVPHAGLVYSGPIAAYGYKLLENSGIDKVILCGPSHYYSFKGVSVYGPGVVWKTPLGKVACDDSLCDLLLKKDKEVSVIPQAHLQEHCLEVQLPYLQTVLKDFKIVPVIMGYPGPATIEHLAAALESLPFDGNTVMISSTDWQHYRPADIGGEMDSIGMECLKKLDTAGLQKYMQEGKVEMCGGAPALSVIKAAMAKGANRVKILKYGDSGNLTGDKSSVVGYVAAVLYKSGDKMSIKKENAVKKSSTLVSSHKEMSGKYNLNDANRKELLRIARKSIEGYLESGKVPEFEVSDDLQKFGAAFVTLTENGQLRGCIGHTTAVEPLYSTVSECAVQAAVSDPRFPPVNREEVDKLHIEISVLTPLQKIASFDEIQVGRDGLMIFKGSHRGLLLPQVAAEYGWDTAEFLAETCRKAGLDREAYKEPDAIIYKFQAVIFGE